MEAVQQLATASNKGSDTNDSWLFYYTGLLTSVNWPRVR